MKTILSNLEYEFEKIHAKFKTVSINHLKDLYKEINQWKQNGLINEEFFKQNYGHFYFKPPVTLPDASSVDGLSPE